MPSLTVEEATKIVNDWLTSFGGAKNIDEWFAHMSSKETEFHPIYPTLLVRETVGKLQETRFFEPPRFAGPKFSSSAREVKVLSDDFILTMTAAENARLERDGAITYHVFRATLIFVKENGKWVMTHDNVSPPGADTPFDHNQFATGELQYSGK